MMERVIGIGEYAVSTKRDEVLVTYSLGSCVGLVLHDPVAGVGGMLHAMLPTAKADPTRAAAAPGVFVDSGTTKVLQLMFDLGAQRANIVAWVAGGARQLDPENIFRVGERNYTVLRKVLWKNGVLMADEDVGGSSSRTVRFEMSSGRAYIKSGGGTREMRPPRKRRG